LPVGWWGERWGFFQASEVCIRQEFQRNTGIQFIFGLNKTYYADRSKSEIQSDSRVNDIPDAYKPYTTVTSAEQGGSFKQIPIGFGFYQEGMISGFRTYGSLGMIVDLWKFDRNQIFEAIVIPPPFQDTLEHQDNWSDVQDGSNIGLQFAAGVIYPLSRGTALDLSLAYHYVGLSKDNSAIAYYGKPARTWTADQKSTAKNHMDFIALRLGVRFGG
jgi:opacity protein-like surface antigen